MIWLGKAKAPYEIKIVTGNGILDQISSIPYYYYGNLTASSITNTLIDAFPQAFMYSTAPSYSTPFGTFTFHNDIGNETA